MAMEKGGIIKFNVMKASILCPISEKKINEEVARINATLTLLLLIIFGLSQSVFPIIVLVFDFLFRATALSKYSPIGIRQRPLFGILI